METITLGQLLGAVGAFAGPAGGYTALLAVIYFIAIGGQLVTRRESDGLVEAQKQVNVTNIANHKEIIRLKDERIALAEGEAERWKQEALAARGITGMSPPPSPSRPSRGSR